MMPGRYSSRANKFLYLGGARMTGAAGPLTKSEHETELLTEKFMPEGSTRPVVVQSGLANDMISLEGFSRIDTGAANIILSDDAEALAAPPERLVTVGEFGDILGQRAMIHRAMVLADGWQTIPGDVLLQFAGMLKTARGQDNDVLEGTIIRAMTKSTGANDTATDAVKARLIDLGAASADGFVVAFHVEQIEFKDRANLMIGISHSVSKTDTPATIADSRITILSTGSNAVLGPLGFWLATTGASRKFVTPRFVFGGAGTSVATTVTYHCAIVRL